MSAHISEKLEEQLQAVAYGGALFALGGSGARQILLEITELRNERIKTFDSLAALADDVDRWLSLNECECEGRHVCGRGEREEHVIAARVLLNEANWPRLPDVERAEQSQQEE